MISPNRDRLKTGFGLEEIHDLAAVVPSGNYLHRRPGLFTHLRSLEVKSPATKSFVSSDISVPRNSRSQTWRITGVKVFHADNMSAIGQ